MEIGGDTTKLTTALKDVDKALSTTQSSLRDVNKLGRNDKEAAHKSIGSAVLLCIVSGLILTAIYLVLQEPILTLFGGRVNEETFRHAKEYFLWITLGVPFYMFGQALNPIIRSDGSPKFAMASTLAGAAANIILDPIFI